MRPQLQKAFGRIALTPIHPAPRLQLGGRRPPRDPHPSSRSRASVTTRQSTRSRDWLRVCGALALATAMANSAANAQPANPTLPDLSGTYRCEGNETTCGWSGSNFTVSQSGSDIQIKNDKGDIGNAKLTSNVTLVAGPIWNMLGVITSPDNQLIQWSNGTTWRKQ